MFTNPAKRMDIKYIYRNRSVGGLQMDVEMNVGEC